MGLHRDTPGGGRLSLRLLFRFFANSKNPKALSSGHGGGFAHSEDGVHWTALPSVASSASSVFRFGPRIWLTARNGVALAVRLPRILFSTCLSTRVAEDAYPSQGPASKPTGPFPLSRVNNQGRLVTMGFVRAWTINSSLVLLTHQHMTTAPTAPAAISG